MKIGVKWIRNEQCQESIYHFIFTCCVNHQQDRTVYSISVWFGINFRLKSQYVYCARYKTIHSINKRK